MKQMKQTIVTILSGILLFGCEADNSSQEDFFPVDGEQRVRRIADAQVAKGAKQDAALQSAHFDGAKLNSLGEAKLDAMIPDEHDADMKVYLNVPESADTTAARKEAVKEYLVAQGLDADHIKIEIGSNPDLGTPAAPGLAGLSRTDIAAEAAAPPADSTAAEPMN